MDGEETSILLSPTTDELVGSSSSYSFSWKQTLYNRKVFAATLASFSIIILSMIDVSLFHQREAASAGNPTNLAKIEYSKTVDFSPGPTTETKMVLDGNIDVMVSEDMLIDCNNKALLGFNMVNYKNVYVAYKYNCDTGDKLENPNDRITDNTIPPGSGVSALENFDVDCSKTGLNYVLTKLYLDANTKTGQYQYEYGCGTFSSSVLSCSTFYTDLAEETDSDHNSVSSLANHPVSCYEGSALQTLVYERRKGEVRYKYTCCTKDPVPTPSPTPLPTSVPLGEPSMEPVSDPTLAPVAVPSGAPVAEPTLEPTKEPVAAPTLAPVADATEAPSLAPVADPTIAPVADATEVPTLAPVVNPSALPTEEPVANPTMAPVADATDAPTLAPVVDPTMAPVADATLFPIPESTDAPIISPTSAPSMEPKADPVLVEAAQLPRYCPFTYLAGSSKVQELSGCVFITQDQIIYMRDDETSPSVYACTSKEDGDFTVKKEDLMRYGLLSNDAGKVSDIRVGANTKFTVINPTGDTLFEVTPEDMRLVHIRPNVDESEIWGGILSTTVSAVDVVLPSDCGGKNNAAAAEAAVEGNKEVDKDENSVEVGEDITESNVAGASVPEAAEPVGSPAGQNAGQLNGIGDFTDGFLTRYWDCCKPSCGWAGKSPYGSIPSCALDGKTLLDIDAKSACEGGTAHACYDQAPWVSESDPDLAFGFVAAPALVPENEICGSCFEIQFSGAGHYWADEGSPLLKNKKLIVQSTNIGHDVKDGQFDLMVPGGGVGLFNGCKNQWHLNAADLGEQHGGFFSTCTGDLAAKKTQLAAKCANLPLGLRAGCLWFNTWFEGADNPNMKYRPIECPAEIISRTGFGAPPVDVTAA